MEYVRELNLLPAWAVALALAVNVLLVYRQRRSLRDPMAAAVLLARVYMLTVYLYIASLEAGAAGGVGAIESRVVLVRGGIFLWTVVEIFSLGLRWRAERLARRLINKEL